MMESAALTTEGIAEKPWTPEKEFPSGITVFDPAGNFNYPVTEEALESHRQFLLANVTDKLDPYQGFIRSYFELDAPTPGRRRQNLNRYAFNLEVLRQSIPDNGSWLDIGAFGHDAIRLKQIKPVRNVRLISFEGGTISIDETGIHHGKRNGGMDTVEIERLDIERAPLPTPSQTINVISAFEILEHFKFGPQNFVMECNRVLADDGLLIISTPNITSAHAISLAMQGESPYESRIYHRKIDFGRVHPLEYDYAQIHSLFTDNGFEIVSLISLSFAPMTEPELAAIKLCSQFNDAIPKSQRNHHFGKHWYITLKKTKTVSAFTYSPAVFE